MTRAGPSQEVYVTTDNLTVFVFYVHEYTVSR